MANYQNNNAPKNPLDPTGRAILTQVAFKGAIEASVAGGSFDIIAFDSTFDALLDKLVSAVHEQKEKFFADAAERKASGAFDAEQSFAAEFGASDASTSSSGGGGGNLEVRKQSGPVPDWLYTQAAAKGVTAVWDNRPDVQGTRKPHFKAVDGDVAFWPPRAA